MQNPKLYEQKCRKGEEFLHVSNDIIPIVKQSLNLAETLSFDYELSDYSLIHSSFLIYLRVLHRTLSNKSKFSQNTLIYGFYFSLRHSLVIPRLYISMIIASNIEDTSHLKSVCAMFPSVSHPLRGLMLRFTAITFFPHDSDILVPFTVTNFNEMMYLINGFLDLYPDEIQTASEWIASNISISLTIVSDSILINHYIDEAISCNIEELGAASINSVVLSIPQHSFEQYLPKLKQYFLHANVNELNIKSVSEIIANVENAKTAYEFMKSIHYEEQCAIDVALSALEEKDYETLSKLEQTDEILMLILEEAGPEVFVDLAKPFERGSPLVKEFVRRLKPSVDPVKTRKIMQNQMEYMDQSLYDVISDVVQYYPFPKEFYEVFFAPPFTFQTSDLLTYVVFRGYSLGINPEKLIGFIRVSKKVPAHIRASNISLLMHGAEFVFYCLSLENERARKVLIRSLDETYSKDLVQKILEKCTGVDEIVMLFHASTQYHDKSLCERILDKLLEKDSEIDSTEQLFQFYFMTILNNLLCSSVSEIPVYDNVVSSILNHLVKATNTAISLNFPITTPNTLKIWMNVVIYGLTLKTMEKFHSQLQTIKDLLPQIV